MTQSPYDRFGPDEYPQEPPQMYAPAEPYQPQPPVQPPAQYDAQQQYPPQQYTPQPLEPALPAPPAKKLKTWMVVLIVVVAVAIVASVGVIGFRAVVGNRLTPYCRSFIGLGSQVSQIQDEFNQAQRSQDPAQISAALGTLITTFNGLDAASPPPSVAPSLTTIISDLTSLKRYTDTKDLMGYITYLASGRSGELTDALTTMDNASVAYCS